jgi:VanZ family protein
LPPRRNSRLVLAALLAAGYWCALAVATHIPTPLLPGEGFDKLYHAAAYAGLSLLLATVWSLWKRPTWGAYAIVFWIVALYGVLDEWLQSHVPGRSADVFDWLADMVGGTAGLVVHLAFAALFITLTRSTAGATPTRAHTDDASHP